MPHVLPWQAFVDAPAAAYIMRQHLANSLYDRLLTRPFLSAIEKVWQSARQGRYRSQRSCGMASEPGVVQGSWC